MAAAEAEEDEKRPVNGCGYEEMTNKHDKTEKNAPVSAREAAYRSLLRIEKEGRYSNLEADLVLKAGGLKEKDRALYTRLVYGTIERKLTLDHHLAALCDRPYEKTEAGVKVLLRLGAYQILFSDRIPDSAAVNESVELCKRYHKSAASFLNAMLRRLAREKNALSYPDEGESPVDYLSVYYSVSRGVCALFLEQFGLERCKSLFAAMNENPPLTLRVNTLKTTLSDFTSLLEERQIGYEKTPFAPFGVRVNAPVSALQDLFDRGLCFVQDEASQLCADALHAKPGDTLSDCCACPGGKSFGGALHMENEGRVLSFDLHQNKLSLIDAGAKRLGITVLTTACADASKYKEELFESADVLLLDVPCSGLGVLAKKPDLRYKNVEETARLPEIQAGILENACRYLKKGGRLVYSTCTLLERENGDRVDAFLESHPEFEEAPLDISCGGDASRLTLFPDIHGTDGFYIAAMVKKG